MIKEQLVSFEVAQLLKAKGFNVIVTDSYRANGQLRGEFKFCNYPAPTQQMAMRWLREKHNIHISTTFGWVSGYNAQVDWAEESEKGNDKPACCVWRTDLNTTYEVAVEAAIKHCLEEIVR